ncbi:hypothetical protein [Iningainema tapete]|uniref:Ferrochelatase n=1 Tax=Iningainema tapete BLCC-T55 TaxID=2748662 RepID=A0A8J6Y339_9CYAN|nr:hypothetical protein [Iningainema tapete BLCC-T55]
MTQNRSFQLLDDILAQQSVNRLSLNPQSSLTTSFVELGNFVMQTTCDYELVKSLRDTLERVLYALLQNFPDNIFWDFDFIVSSMLKQALAQEDKAEAFLESFGDKIVSLMSMFGKHSEIRFRYTHDFIYGFDWAKWVQKESHCNIDEPFSLTFLDCLLTRGQEITQLIKVDDAKYHRLAGKLYRNPFCFSREPEDERRLLLYLAQKQLIPVATWSWNACPVWNKPFHQMREQLSLKLNIPRTN